MCVCVCVCINMYVCMHVCVDTYIPRLIDRYAYTSDTDEQLSFWVAWIKCQYSANS